MVVVDKVNNTTHAQHFLELKNPIHKTSDCSGRLKRVRSGED